MSFIPIPCPPASGGGGGTPGIDVEQNLLCDVGPDGEVFGTALAVYEYDATGAPTGPPTFVDPATGNPYVIQGVLKPCDASIPGVANIFATCADTPREAIVTGPNLVENGDFAQSEGIGNTSTAGPGFSTGYNPSVTGNLFDPMDGAEHFAYFDTNAGQVTGNDVNAVPIPALSTKSFAVNVGPNNATPILSWQVELVNGKTYEIGADVAIIYPPYAIEMQIDGVKILDMTAPSVQSQWQHRGDQFVWTGATGLHTLTLNSSDPSPQGNDHAFDNFSIREVTPAQPGVTTEVDYSNTVRAVVDQIVQTTGCNDDRRDSLLATLVDSLTGSGGSAGNQVVVDQICVAGETFARVTIYNGGSGAIVNTSYFGSDGVAEPAPVSYTQGPCSVDVEQQVLCDANGPFLRTYHYDNGIVTSAVDTDFQLGPYVPVPPIGLCPVEVSVEPTEFEFEEQVLCDDNGPFFRRTIFNTATQAYSAVADFTLAGAPYVTVGTVNVCGGDASDCCPINVGEGCTNTGSGTYVAIRDGDGTITLIDPVTGSPVTQANIIPCVQQVEVTNDPLDVNVINQPLDVNVIDDDDFDVEQEFLCDDNGVFIRQYTYVDGVFTGITNLTLAGAPYVPVGTVANDCPTAVNTSFTRQLCDDNGPFNRTFVYDIDGNLISFADQNIVSGTPYTPVGIVISCNSHDSQWITLCDDNGPFLRRISYFNQGAFVSSVQDFLLDGLTGYNTVGTVKVCGSAPVVLGELCASAPDPNAPPLSFSGGTGNADFVEGPDNTFTAVNYQGSGVDVTMVVDPGLAAVLLDATHMQLNGAGNFPISVSFSQPVTVRGITFGEMDASFADETFSDYSIPPTGVTGALTLGPGPTYFTNTTINDGNPDGEVQFNTLTNNFTFNYQGNGLGTWIQGLRFEMPNPATIDQTVIAVKCDGCDGGVAYFNKESGLEVLNPTIVDCPAQEVTISGPVDINEPVTIEFAPETIDSTIQRQTGAGAIVIPANARSITFVSLAGAPTVQIGGDPAVAVPAGATLTWSSEDRGEGLTNAYTLTAGAADDFIVITTRL